MIKPIRFTLILITVSLAAAIFTGCWNYREIESISIAYGGAFDIDPQNGRYRFSAEIVELKSPKEAKISSKIVSAEGDTVFDAARNVIKVTGKKLYWGHANVIFISRSVAEGGVVPILDWITRDAEPRLDMDILLSKETSAKETLELKSPVTDILSQGIAQMLDAEKSLAKAPVVRVLDFINNLSGKGVSAVLPTVQPGVEGDKNAPEITGTGVFKKDKLVGFLNEEETKYLLFVKNEIKGGLLYQKNYSNGQLKTVSLEIFKSGTKVKPNYFNGKLSMNININTEVAIGEHGGTANFIEEKGREKLKKDSEEALRQSIKNLVIKVQKEYKSDIFGFGSTVKREMPALWKTIEPRWEEVFENLEIEVNPTIKIINSAEASKPLEIGE